MKRYEGLNILLGSLLMFLTFVVNNVYREQIASEADAINAAEATFLIRDSNFELFREIDEVDADIARLNNELTERLPKLQKGGYGNVDPETLLNRSSVEELRLQNETRSEFDNLARLILKISPTYSNARELNALFKEFDTLSMKELTPVSPIDAIKDKSPEAVAAFDKENIRHYLEFLSIHEKLKMLAAEAVDEAQAQVQKREDRLSTFRPLGYLLFCLGLLLAVISKLAGIESIEASAE